MRTQSAVMAVLCLAAGTAFAEPGTVDVDLYYVPIAEVEATFPGVGTGGDHGNGFGVRAFAPVMDGLAVSGEYQSVSYQDFDDLTQYRVGAGWVGESGSGLFAEYVVTDDALESDGYAVHARLSTGFVYGQVGYLWLDSDDLEDKAAGLEFTVGAVIPVSERFSGFVDVRKTALGHDRSEFEAEISDLRAGVRVTFGGGADEPAAEPEAPEVVEPEVVEPEAAE